MSIYPTVGHGHQDVAMPIVDLSASMKYRAVAEPHPYSTWRPEVARAIDAAAWPGIALPLAEVLGVRVYPVVELIGAKLRVQASSRPERCLATLELWESKLEGWATSPQPLRIVGFVSVAPRWQDALRDLQALSGLGAGLVFRRSAAKSLQLLEADVAEVWVAALDAQGEASLQLSGRSGPVTDALRVPATRLIEEGLFEHALAAGVVR